MKEKRGPFYETPCIGARLGPSATQTECCLAAAACRKFSDFFAYCSANINTDDDELFVDVQALYRFNIWLRFYVLRNNGSDVALGKTKKWTIERAARSASRLGPYGVDCRVRSGCHIRRVQSDVTELNWQSLVFDKLTNRQTSRASPLVIGCRIRARNHAATCNTIAFH